MSIKVSDQYPLPQPPPRGRAWNTKYPWGAMAVGQSFFVPDGRIATMSRQAIAAAQRTGFHFTCRTVKGGVRVWRDA